MKFILISILTVSVLSCKSSRGTRSNLKDADERQGEIMTKAHDLGMNDVSILFPIKKVKDLVSKLPTLTAKPDPAAFPLPEVQAAPGDPAEGFVPSWMGTELSKTFRQSGINKTDDLSHFRLTGMRANPCANNLDAKNDDKLCLRTLQFTWQTDTEANLDQDTFNQDANIHTIYRLDDGEFKTVLAVLRRLHKNASVDTIKLPLQPQPVIAQEGLNSAYLSGVLGIVHNYAKASRLIAFAALASNAKFAQLWAMSQFTVNDGKAVRIPIPTLQFSKPGDVEKQTFSLVFDSGDLSPIPQTQSPLRSVGIPSNTFGRGAPIKPEVLAKAKTTNMNNSYPIENPFLHSARTLDCASCHMAYNSVDDRAKGIADGSFTPPVDAYQSKTWDLSVTGSKTLAHSRLQMFSYVGDQYKIVPRVINETAFALDYIELNGL